MVRFILNENEVSTSLPPGMLLLDYVRYHRHLMGTKIGCREGDCGACTVLVGELKGSEIQYRSMTSCLVPLGNAAGKHIVTVEGINQKEGLNPIQVAMADAGATQCGFCTPGFVVSLAGFCLGNTEAEDQDAVAAIDGNICRCTGYKSIERAANKIAATLRKKKQDGTSVFEGEDRLLPSYFSSIKGRLRNLSNGQVSIPETGTTSRTIVGGGTDLYVQKHDELTHASIQFVFGDPGLNFILKEGDRCIIGPSATVTDLLESPVIMEHIPSFDRYAELVSSTPIRNMATIAGNFVNASPIGDLTILFLALDAQLCLTDGKTKRELPLRKFYKGYKELNKRPGEYIEQIWFPSPATHGYFNFEKVSKRTRLDIASVNTAIWLEIKNNTIAGAALSAGGVAPIPLYLQKTAAFLKGKEVTIETINEAIEIMKAEISPISDARGTKEYKSLLLGQLIKAHFIKLFPGSDLMQRILNKKSG